MALLDNISYSPGEPIQDFYDKIIASINAINATLGGGTTDQIPSKVNSTDFNIAMVNSILPLGNNLKVKTVQIGDWNMDTTGTVSVAHGMSATDYKNIRHISAVVRNDANTEFYPLNSMNSASGQIRGGISKVDATNVIMFRTVSIGYDADVPNFDSTSYNRGYITIIYEA